MYGFGSSTECEYDTIAICEQSYIHIGTVNSTLPPEFFVAHQAPIFFQSTVLYVGKLANQTLGFVMIIMKCLNLPPINRKSPSLEF